MAFAFDFGGDDIDGDVLQASANNDAAGGPATGAERIEVPVRRHGLRDMVR